MSDQASRLREMGADFHKAIRPENTPGDGWEVLVSREGYTPRFWKGGELVLDTKDVLKSMAEARAWIQGFQTAAGLF